MRKYTSKVRLRTLGIDNPSVYDKIRFGLQQGCYSRCRGRWGNRVGWKGIRGKQHREKKLPFKVGDCVFWRPYGEKIDLVFPAVVKDIQVNENWRNRSNLYYVVDRLDLPPFHPILSWRYPTEGNAEEKELELMPETESAMYKLKF